MKFIDIFFDYCGRQFDMETHFFDLKQHYLSEFRVHLNDIYPCGKKSPTQTGIFLEEIV